jgi:hypothetical protein
MYTVSGCPRSGTSLLMNIMRVILGDESIVAEKGHFGNPHKYVEEAKGEDRTHQHEVVEWLREYAFKRSGKDPDKYKEIREQTKDLNPNGFFESRYTVQGIRYNRHDRENLKKYAIDNDHKLCIKIVSQGLLKSDPSFIHKVIYMVRHPRAVAKSQERLRTQLDDLFDGTQEYDDTKPKLVRHSPQHYLNSTKSAATFFVENPDVEVHFVMYDELVSDPESVIKDLARFMNLSEDECWSKTKDIVDPKLKRSYPEDIESELWEESEHVYDMFLERKFQEIVDYLGEKERKLNQHNLVWKCVRFDTPTNINQCMNCINNPVTRNQFKKNAFKRKVDWRNLPCLFECIYDLSREDDELLTVEESIENNFWKFNVKKLDKSKKV